MDLQQRLAFFRETVACNQALYYFRYSAGGALLESDCPRKLTFDAIFRHLGYHQQLYQAEGAAPIIFCHEIGLCWIAGKEMAGDELVQVYVFGPFYANSCDPYFLESVFQNVLEQSESEESAQELNQLLAGLPAVSSILYLQYGVLLHYCLTQQHIGVSDLQLVSTSSLDTANFSHLESHRVKDRLPLYRAERALLDLLREGDMDFSEAQANAAAVVRIPHYTDNDLKNRKIYAIIFISQCSRAAIEGGLSVSLGYSLGDAYIKSALMAHSARELDEVSRQMYKDFVQRVRSCQVNKSYSPMVQSCCDFIRLHFAEPITIETLADRLGYAKYYLSTCFKKETGVSVNSYIKFARIERAKMLLSTTALSIEEIALKVGFASRIFFDRVFREEVGVTPKQYRMDSVSL